MGRLQLVKCKSEGKWKKYYIGNDTVTVSGKLITLSMSRCDPDPPMFEAVLHNSTCIHNTEMYLLCILIYLFFRPEIQK